MGLNLKEMVDRDNNIEIGAGYYPGRLIGIAELGLQKKQYKGVPKRQHLVALLFEVYVLGMDEKPMLLSKDFNKIIKDNSNLGKAINALRKNTEFTPEEMENYNLSRLLGSLCNIYVDNYEKGGQIKQVIKDVDVLIENTKLPESSTKYVYFKMDNSETWSSFADMPPWIQIKNIIKI